MCGWKRWRQIRRSIFDITVEARNSAPILVIIKVVNKTDHSLPVLTIPETERMVTTVVKDVLVDITPGTWDEWDQALRFKVDLISGDESIVNDLRLIDGGSLMIVYLTARILPTDS